MPPSLDPKMMWVLGQVTISGVEGVSIEQLFEQIQKDPSIGTLNEETKNQLWGELLGSEEFVIGDTKGHELMRRKNLCLDDVYGFEMQIRKVRLRSNAAERQSTNSVTPPVTTTLVPVAPVAQVTSNGRGSQRATPSAEVPNDSKPSTRSRKPSRKNESSASASKEAPRNSLKYLRQAKFTSYKDMMREEDDILRKAGVPRVYIDPYTAQAPKDWTAPKRGPPTMIALFKSDKLRDPEWLKSQARAWKLPEPEVSVEEASEGPLSKKRGGNKKVSAVDESEGSESPVDNGREASNAPTTGVIKPPPKKRGRPRKNPAVVTTMTGASAPASSTIPTQPESGTQELSDQIQHHAEALSSAPQSQGQSIEPPPQISTLASLPQTLGSQVLTNLATIPLLPPANNSYRSPYQMPQSYGSSDAANSDTTLPSAATPSYTTPYTSPYIQGTSVTHPPILDEQTNTRKRKATGTLGAAAKREKLDTTLPGVQVPFSTVVPQISAVGGLSHISDTHVEQVLSEGLPLTRSTMSVEGVPRIAQPLLEAELPLREPLVLETAFTREVSQSRQASAGPNIFPPPQTSPRKTSPFEASQVLDPVGQKAALERLQLREMKEAELQRALEEASAVQIPDITARFSAKYQDVVGNVVLSADQSTVTFRGVLQNSSESPLLVLPMSRFTQYPILSTKGSNPMELFAHVQDDGGQDVIYRFNFGRDPNAFDQANNMRAKLCQAWVTRVKTSNDSLPATNMISKEMQEALPFFCPNEGCGRRWKNREGILYHYAKSKTSCNKSWVAPVVAASEPRRKRVRKAKGAPTKRTPSPNDETIESDDEQDGEPTEKETPEQEITEKEAIEQEAISGVAQLLGPIENSKMPQDDGDYASDSSSDDSLQSIIEYATKASAPKLRTTSKRRRQDSVVFNEEDLQALVNEAADLDVQNPANGMTDNTPTEDVMNAQELTKEIIVSLVSDNNGVFPGDKSLWYAVFATCLKQAARSRLVITADACSDALLLLLAEGRIKTIQVSFSDKHSNIICRDIITDPLMDIKSPNVEKLQYMLQDAYPEYFVPSQFAPDEKSLSILRKVSNMAEPTPVVPGPAVALTPAGPKTTARTPKRRKVNTYLSAKSPALSASSFGGADVSEIDNKSEEEVDVVDQDMDDLYEDGESVSTTNHGSRARRSGRARVPTNFGDGIVATPIQPAPREPKRVRIPFTEEQKQRRDAKAARIQQSWQQAPPFLQAENGAWDQTPMRVKPPSRVKNVRRLPEPITYMQAPDGSWSIRPYGHGVRPIFSRPSRQAVGNPMLPTYLARRDNGFRPVIIPEGKRLFLPGLPSKHIIGEPVAPKPRRPRRAASKRTSSSLNPGELEVSPAASDDHLILKTEEDLDFYSPALSTTRSRRFSNRRGSTLRSESVVSLESEDPPSPKVQVRRSSRPSASIHREGLVPTPDFFNSDIFEPKASHRANPGLSSLPPSFGLGLSDVADATPDQASETVAFDVSTAIQDRIAHLSNHVPTTQQACVLTDIEQTEIWEQGVAQDYFVGSTAGPSIAWVNHTLTDFKYSFGSEITTLNWEEDTAFTMTNLPYEELVNADLPEYMDDLVDVPAKPRYRISENDIQAKNVKRVARDPALQLKTRPTTILASDFNNIADDPVAAAKELGFQIVPIDAIARKGRKAEGMSRYDENKMLVAVVAVRVLAGGIEQTIDWLLVGMIMNQFSVPFLTRQWNAISPKKKSLLQKLTKGFQEAFLQAYEIGEVPPINYDDLPSYNWGRLAEWTMTKFSNLFEIKALELPGSRELLLERYELIAKEKNVRGREDYFTNRNQAVAHRLEEISFYPATAPVKSQMQMPLEEMELSASQVARSMVRATAFTPEDAYDKDMAIKKLTSINSNDVEEAIATLKKEKVIVKRKGSSNVPGRQFEPAVAYTRIELVKLIRDEQVVDAMKFKRFLDREFANGKECVRANYSANEGSMLCVTQLQSHGRIRLQGVNIPNNKFGFTESVSYITKMIPQKTWVFQVDIYPTDTYVYDRDIDVINKAKDVEPPRGGPTGEIPVWYGIGDQVIAELWGKVLTAVCGTVALRSGINFESLKAPLEKTMEAWELRLLMIWGENIGLFHRVKESVEGWTVSEWWWIMAGQFCETSL